MVQEPPIETVLGHAIGELLARHFWSDEMADDLAGAKNLDEAKARLRAGQRSRAREIGDAVAAGLARHAGGESYLGHAQRDDLIFVADLAGRALDMIVSTPEHLLDAAAWEDRGRFFQRLDQAGQDRLSSAQPATFEEILGWAAAAFCELAPLDPLVCAVLRPLREAAAVTYGDATTADDRHAPRRGRIRLYGAMPTKPAGWIDRAQQPTAAHGTPRWAPLVIQSDISGVGASQLAAEYVRSRLAVGDFPVFAWLTADSKVSLITSMLDLAFTAGVGAPGHPNLDPQRTDATWPSQGQPPRPRRLRPCLRHHHYWIVASRSNRRRCAHHYDEERSR